MRGKNLLLTWIVVIAGLFLSSCAFNLFADLELQNLLSSGTTDQKLSAASGALSSKNYDKAIALAGSVLNDELDLGLTNEQLMKLLDSTSTLYDFAKVLYDKKDELTDQAIEAVKILIQAAAEKSGKSLVDVISDLEDIAQELGWDLSNIMPESKNGDGEDFWQIVETNAGTVVSILASFMDNTELLKLLTSGYYILATATQTEDSSPVYAGFCVWYDLCYMFNLVFDTNNDGKVTDENLIKAAITNPASFTELASDTTSGLYQDKKACDEFIWAYEIMQDVFEILNIEMSLPTMPATDDLYDTQYLQDLFEVLGGGA